MKSHEYARSPSGKVAGAGPFSTVIAKILRYRSEHKQISNQATKKSLDQAMFHLKMKALQVANSSSRRMCPISTGTWKRACTPAFYLQTSCSDAYESFGDCTYGTLSSAQS